MLQEDLTKTFQKVMERNGFDSWLKAREIVQNYLAKEIELPRMFKYDLRDQVRRVKNFLMLLYVYSLGVELSFSSYTSYRELFDHLYK